MTFNPNEARLIAQNCAFTVRRLPDTGSVYVTYQVCGIPVSYDQYMAALATETLHLQAERGTL